MTLLWIAVFATSMTWLFSLRLYISPNYFGTSFLIGVSILAAAIALRRMKLKVSMKYVFLSPLLVIPSWILPFPYNLGPILVLLGLLIIPLSKRWSAFPAVSLSLFLTGTLLLLQGVLPHLYFIFTSKSHFFHALSPFVYHVLKFTSLPVSFSQNTIFIRMFRELYAFPTTWEKLAIFPYLSLFTGGVFLLFLFSKRENLKKIIPFFLLTGFVYLILRYILMILLFLYTMYFVDYDVDITRVDLFWKPTFTLLSFMPFLFLLWKFFPLAERREITFSLPPRNRRTIIAGLSFSLGVILLLALFGFHDPGRVKAGRVLIDEKHSDWEKTTRPYDTEWYGVESGYNYACIADYLSYYYKLDRAFQEITPDLLSNYDILLLKIPSLAYSRKEIDAIIEFVEKGGGLYLIGDHTNVFGSGYFLNEIARHFGFLFRYDCLFDFEKTFNQLYTPPRILPHPIVNRMPPLLFAVSCSIQPLSLFAEKVILGNGLKALDIDYASGNFYPQVRDKTEMTFGSYVQMIAVKHGKGRVAGFTDSTVFSNFSAFIAGKPELLLGTMDWLNRRNHLDWLNRLFFIFSLFAFGLSLLLTKKNLGFVFLLLILGVFWATVSLYGFTLLTRMNYPLPEPHTQPTRVFFEKDYSDYELPLTRFVEDYDRSYAIFYQWVLRLGYFPSVGRSLEECIEHADLVVLINPHKEFTSQKIDELREYLARGGKALVMDSPFNESSTSNQLLKNFGMQIHREDTISTIQGATELQANHIEGGGALLITEDGKVVLSTVREGKGTLALLTFSDRFVDSQMGRDESLIPNEYLLQVYQLEFAIIRGLIKDDIAGELSAWSVGSNPEN